MKRALVIGAHLDDAVIAVGGLIAQWARAGVEVSVVCFGNGDEAFTDMAGQAGAVARFKADADKAHEVLGVKNFTCYDWPDFGVQKNRKSYRQCIQAIRDHRPDVILGHYWNEYFQHRDATRLSLDAWWQSAWACSADLGKPWKAERFYHFEVVHDLPEPTHLVDVSDSFDAKLAAWRCFESAEEHLGSMAEQLEARARFHGSKIGVKYAEALRRSYFVPEKVENSVEGL